MPRQIEPARRVRGLRLFLVQRFIPEFLAGRSHRTVGSYKQAVTAFCKYLQREPRIEDITDEMVTDFRTSLQQRGISAQTIRNWCCGIRAIVHHARPNVCAPRARVAFDRTKKPAGNGFSADYDSDLDIDGSLWRFLQATYAPMKLIGCSAGTKKQHEIAIRRLCRFAGRSVLLSDLSDDLVCRYMQWMLDTGLERATVNSARGHILANWRFAKKRKLITELPDVDKIRGLRKLPTAWTLPELERLLGEASRTRGNLGTIPAAKFWPALLLFLYYTGLRLSAALSVRRTDVDLETGWIKIPAEVQKQKVEQRFRLPTQAVDALRTIWIPERREVFPWPFVRKRLWEHYSGILKRAGLYAPRQKRFHRMRQTAASHIAAIAGISAAARHLGHNDEAVVMRYIDPRFLADRDATHILPQPNLPRLLNFERPHETQ